MRLHEETIEFVLRTNLRFGVGAAKQLPHHLDELSYRRIAIVVDMKLFNNVPVVSEIIEDCKKSFDSVIVEFYAEEFEPSYNYLDRVKLRFKQGTEPLVDCIVGIGGGSVLDVAKGIATLATNHGHALEYRGFPKNLNPSLPMIAIPSTAGTGSEVSFNASFIDSDRKVKMGINTASNYPVLAILDPLIVCRAPKAVVISSGVDALVHALESYVSKKTNTVVRLFAKEALRFILPALPLLVEHMDDVELWAKMQIGAYLAMIALANSSSGPAAGLSYLLGTHYGVPHGIAGGVFIGRIARVNHEQGYYGYADLYDLISNDNLTRGDEEQKSHKVVAYIEKLLKNLGVPDTLTAFGIGKKDLPLFYDFAVTTLKGSFDLNPVFIPEDRRKQFLNSMT